jgi:hypothetical protein
MPNWCDNSVTLRNEDKSKIDALAASLEGEDKAFLNHLRPNPSGEWDYNWSIENWGTKWEAGIIDWERRDDNEVWVSFDSAWSPPTVIYDYLVEQGWEVDAVYHEPGMAYAGLYTTDGGDDYYEYDITDESSIEELPSDIVEFAGLEDAHRDWIISEMEEQWGDAERTDWYPADAVAPEHEGYYEITTKGWDFPQFCKWDGERWDCYNEVVQCRGLVEDPNWDSEAELEKIAKEFNEAKVD